MVAGATLSFSVPELLLSRPTGIRIYFHENHTMCQSLLNWLIYSHPDLSAESAKLIRIDPSPASYAKRAHLPVLP
jgi:hypothetical protein